MSSMNVKNVKKLIISYRKYDLWSKIWIHYEWQISINWKCESNLSNFEYADHFRVTSFINKTLFMNLKSDMSLHAEIPVESETIHLVTDLIEKSSKTSLQTEQVHTLANNYSLWIMWDTSNCKCSYSTLPVASHLRLQE